MRELEDQSFDSELGEFVYDFRNYDVGDVVQIKSKSLCKIAPRLERAYPKNSIR